MRLSVTRTARICPSEIAANISGCVTGKVAQPQVSLLFPAAFTLAHRALAAAERAARPAAENFLLAFLLGTVPLILAHLALAAAAMAARAAALIRLLPLFGLVTKGIGTSPPPRILARSFCRSWIFSWMLAARRNALGDRFVIEFMVQPLLRELKEKPS